MALFGKRNMLEAVLLVVLLCIFPCQTNKFEAKIVNGQLSRIIDFSYSAFLNVACKNSQPWSCGSSILNQYILLTAAHCLHGSIPSCTFVRTGNAHRYKGMESLVMKHRIHPRYWEGEPACDIALMMLYKPLIFGKNVGRVAIMRTPPYNESGLVAGWGLSDEIRPFKTLWLQHTSQKITRRVPCQKVVGNLPPGVICGGALDQKSYPAQGDSGSALVVRGFIQVGLVSYKFEAISKSVVIYTDIGHYYSWIQANALWLYCGML